MKKWILVAIVSTMSLNVLNAQNFYQGEKAIAARVSGLDLKLNLYDKQKNTVSFDLGLKGDYFVIDNLTITAGFDLRHNEGDNSLIGELGCKYYFWEYLYGGVFYQGLYDYGRINSRGKLEMGATLYISRYIFIEPSIFFLRGEHPFAFKKAEMFSQFGLAVSFGVNF